MAVLVLLSLGLLAGSFLSAYQSNSEDDSSDSESQIDSEEESATAGETNPFLDLLGQDQSSAEDFSEDEIESNEPLNVDNEQITIVLSESDTEPVEIDMRDPETQVSFNIDESVLGGIHLVLTSEDISGEGELKTVYTLYAYVSELPELPEISEAEENHLFSRNLENADLIGIFELGEQTTSMGQGFFDNLNDTPQLSFDRAIYSESQFAIF